MEKENRREKTERSEGEKKAKQEESSIKRSPIERESKRTS